jgi:hypothetical protein
VSREFSHSERLYDVRNLLFVFSSRFLGDESPRNDKPKRVVMTSALLFLRVLACAHQMQRNVRLIPNDPTVVSRCDVKDISSFHLDNSAVIHGRCCSSGDDHSNMFD